jgi:hypothetical protein
MNESDRSEVLWEIDHVTERRGNPGVDGVLPESCPNQQFPRRNPLVSRVPDEGAFETFVGGTGIYKREKK